MCKALKNIYISFQDPANKQYFTPDAKMAKVFGTEKIRGFGMTKYLNAHLTPIEDPACD